jgi:hypothetical protein
MTTREWHEADQDDADRVRAWPAQDAQEPEPDPAPCQCPEHLTYRASLAFNSDAAQAPNGSDVAYLRAEVAALKADQAHTMSWYKTVCELLTEHTAERDLALAAVARVEALASQWERVGPGHWECAAQLLQALDEAAHGITGVPVGWTPSP